MRQTILRHSALHGRETDYLLYLPPGYNQGRDEKPLLLFLHGAGQRGSDPSMLSAHGPPKLVEEGRDFPFILASPQCPAGGNWVTRDLKEFLDFLCEEYRVDRSRLYLTGLSMGGFATWNLASEYPDMFAAIIPICGGGDFIRPLLLPEAKREALKTLPVRTFHGDNDQVVPVGESLRMVEIFRRAGNTQVELTVYPGVEHDSWTQTYAAADLFAWLLEHRR